MSNVRKKNKEKEKKLNSIPQGHVYICEFSVKLVHFGNCNVNNISVFHQTPLQHPISPLSASNVIIYCDYAQIQEFSSFSR